MTYHGIKLMNLFLSYGIERTRLVKNTTKGKTRTVELMACGFSHVDFLLFYVFPFLFLSFLVAFFPPSSSDFASLSDFVLISWFHHGSLLFFHSLIRVMPFRRRL